MNFCKRSYQPILRYLCTEVKKRRGEILLHKYFKDGKPLKGGIRDGYLNQRQCGDFLFLYSSQSGQPERSLMVKRVWMMRMNTRRNLKDKVIHNYQLY